VLAAICFHFLGYTLPAFAVYLFLFSFLCMLAGWQEAITTDSVLISHFFQEGNMGLSILGNETLLLLIGAGMGVLMNLHLHSKDADYAKMEAEVDDRIKEILRRLADGLSAEQESFYFLEQALQKAKICAAVNYKNTFFRKDMYPLEYIRMRSQQTVVLKGICENLRKVSHLPKQALAVAALFGDVEQAYQKENTVVKLLGRLYEVMEDMKKEKLPQSREEFEARAILYYVLLQMEEFLIIKKEFAKGLKMRVEQ